MTTLERLPPDDPEYARILTVMAIDVLQLPLSRRGAVPMARLSTRLEQAVAKLPADDPLKVVGEAMIWAIVFARGVTEHQPEQCQQATEGLIQIAENTPAGHPFRPFAYFGVASAFFDQATMTGELRLMERSRSDLNQGIALVEAVDPAPEFEPGRALLFYLRALTELFALVHQPERADASQAVSDLRQAVDLIPPDHPLRPRIVADLDSVRVVRAAWPRMTGHRTWTALSGRRPSGFWPLPRTSAVTIPTSRCWRLRPGRPHDAGRSRP